MTNLVGTKIPEANFIIMTASGPDSLSIKDITQDKKVIIFAVPGAFTPTCTQTHLPGFVENGDALRAKGVDGIFCVTVNDAFVANAWGDMIGAAEAGVQVLADADSSFTKAMSMDFDGAPVGLFSRSKRYAMIVENSIITHFEVEESPGTCSISSAEHLLSIV